jgi:chitodextrinase
MLSPWLGKVVGPRGRRPNRRPARRKKPRLQLELLEDRTAPATLVAAYGFNEGAGTTVADASGNGNTGTVANATWTTAGKYGNALVFNGTSSRVSINDAASLHLTTAMTLEAWVKPSTSSSDWHDVIYKGDDAYYLEGSSSHNGKPAGGGTFGAADVQTYGTAALAVNAWTHLAVTYDGATLKLYVNGALASSLARTGNILTSTNQLQIGGDSLYGQYFQGTIDEVRVYNTALTQAQVQSDMNTPIAPDTTPPTAPGSLMATAVSRTQINLSWTASTDPDDAVATYYVERQDPGAGYVQIGTTPGTITTFSSTGLTAGTLYNYRVRASDTAGNLGPYSTPASATTLPPDTTPPTAPGSLTASAVSGSQINLSWTASTDPDDAVATYYVERQDPGAGFVQIGTTPGTVTTFSSTGLSPSTTYNYRVRASDTAGNLGPYSTPASATTLATIPGLVAAYSFNEGTGTTVADASGNGNTGTVANATWTAAGKYGSALVFNGTNARININDAASLHLTTAMTMEAWVNPTAAGTAWEDVIYKGNDAYYLEGATTSSGKPGAGGTFGTADVQTYGTAALPVNAWTHLAVTYDGATLKLYVNGALASSLARTGNILTSTNQLQIGGDSLYGQYFQGTIDEVRVYNTALTQAQVQSDMNAPIGLGITPGVVELTTTRTQQFTANSSGVVWSVDGVAGGSATVGTITAAGLYTPPASAGTHVVTATKGGLSAGATVYVTTYAGTFTHQINNMRTGANLNETVLTPANVNPTNFGKLFTYATDGVSHAGSLYVANVNVPGMGYHNVVYVSTEHDSVYAFDADGLSVTPLWKASFINPAAGVTTIPAADTGETGDIFPEIGITGTPVIDPASGTLYVVAATKEVSGTTTSYVQRLHALDIATGAEKLGGPVVIQASVSGTGDGSVGGVLSFNALRENQRPALLLTGGVVYIGFASHGDVTPYHGWVLGYNATTLKQVMVYSDTANAFDGGIWQSGAGLATDATGNIYFVTGNGTFDANTGGVDYGDSFVKLSPAGAVLDYFTPYNQATFDANNVDLGAGGLLLLPDQAGAHPHEMLTAGKSGTIYVVDRDNLGHFHAGSDSQIIQSLVNIFPNGSPITGNFSAPVYFNGTVYFSPISDVLQAFRVTNGLLSTSPTSETSDVFAFPGGMISVSANGNTNGIVWAVQRNGDTSPGVLKAYDATNLANELYSSDQYGTRDTLDVAAKFSLPLVANGKVYVASKSQFAIYGLLPSGASPLMIAAPAVLAGGIAPAQGAVAGPNAPVPRPAGQSPAPQSLQPMPGEAIAPQAVAWVAPSRTDKPAGRTADPPGSSVAMTGGTSLWFAANGGWGRSAEPTPWGGRALVTAGDSGSLGREPGDVPVQTSGRVRALDSSSGARRTLVEIVPTGDSLAGIDLLFASLEMEPGELTKRQ